MASSFEDKLRGGSVQQGDCRVWTKTRVKRGGYGKVAHRGRYWLAHRAAWFLTHGEEPDAVTWKPECPNPGVCIAPEHLTSCVKETV